MSDTSCPRCQSEAIMIGGFGRGGVRQDGTPYRENLGTRFQCPSNHVWGRDPKGNLIATPEETRPMKKLYVVDVQHTVYVMAEDEREAEREALSGIRENHDAPTCMASEVKSAPIDSEWRDALPYGNEDERTVSEIAEWYKPRLS